MNLYQLKIETAKLANIFIYDDETKSKVESKAKKAIREGHMVTWMDGTKQWSDLNPIVEGLEYVWHSDGNRIKCTKVIKTLSTDGTIVETALPSRFVDYLKVMN